MTALQLSVALKKIEKHVDPDDHVKKVSFYNGSATVTMDSKMYFHIDIISGSPEVTMKSCWQSSIEETI